MEHLIERDIEKDILKWLHSKEIIAIRGPRQSGKTTLLQKIMANLKKRISEKRIHFASFEDDFEKDKFEKDPREYFDFFIGEDREKHYFFLDEVQYAKTAGKLLKLIYDSKENVKIIITGSSTLDINDIGSYLVGRVLFFELYPFSFGEFLRAKNEQLHTYYMKNKFDYNTKKEVNTLFLDKLNPLLKEYIIFGGYPKVVLEKEINNKKFLLKNLYLTYIEKDIVKVYGINYRQKIIDLIKYLASINSAIINYDAICSQIGLYNKELKQILSIIEGTYIVKLIRPYHKNLVSELRKNPKSYFVDTGLRNFITERFDFSDDEWGKLYENHVLNIFRAKKVNFWRTTAKAEVDFVLEEKLPIEVKIHPKIARSLRSFLLTYTPEIAVVANLTSFEKNTIEKTQVYFVPLALI